MRDQIVMRIESIRDEIQAWLDVPSHDGPASASISLVYEQVEAESRLPRLREELATWTEALAELDRFAELTRGANDAPAPYLPAPELRAVIEAVDRLTPSLISHLRSHHDDIRMLPWDVFEHLVGEWLITTGFEDVRLVGRDRRTAADLYAVHAIRPAGIPIRFFVEVKRTHRKADVRVINTVVGAFVAERPILGWHAAIIVASGGFTNSERYNKQQLSCLGIELRDRNDLIKWLEGYAPRSTGLWLPSPDRVLPVF